MRSWAPTQRPSRFALRRRVAWIATLIALPLLAACRGSPPAEQPGVATSKDIITADELNQANAQNVYEAIEKLRPVMLRGRGLTTFRAQVTQTPNVYLDSQRLGGVDVMRSIPLTGIAYIRYVNAAEAQGRWGPNNTSGVIWIVTVH